MWVVFGVCVTLQLCRFLFLVVAHLARIFFTDFVVQDFLDFNGPSLIWPYFAGLHQALFGRQRLQNRTNSHDQGKIQNRRRLFLFIWPWYFASLSDACGFMIKKHALICGSNSYLGFLQVDTFDIWCQRDFDSLFLTPSQKNTRVQFSSA